jgi:hypothetical protein
MEWRPSVKGERLMRLRIMMLGLLAMLFAGSALAHGNKVHVRGTIEKVNADSMVIKTPDGKSVEVKLVAATVYLLHVIDKSAKPSDASEDKPAKASDLAAGELVVIHATPKDNALEADEIKFSVPAPAKTAAPAQPSPKP